jgi:hypothetical protein
MEDLTQFGLAGVITMFVLKEVFGFLREHAKAKKEKCDDDGVADDIRADRISEAIIRLTALAETQVKVLERCAEGHDISRELLYRIEARLNNTRQSN